MLNNRPYPDLASLKEKFLLLLNLFKCQRKNNFTEILTESGFLYFLNFHKKTRVINTTTFPCRFNQHIESVATHRFIGYNPF